MAGRAAAGRAADWVPIRGTHRYSDTLQLPATDFPFQADVQHQNQHVVPQVLDDVYAWQTANVAARLPHQTSTEDNVFVLHDGPPYANGALHTGHAMNKVLKDIICRWQLLHHNRRVMYRPGWDTHGLPIELKAVQALRGQKVDVRTLPALELRQHCRNLALTALDEQRREFRSFGVMGEWDRPYVTLSPEYEAAQLRLFRSLFHQGLVTRQEKPVYWSCETGSALAEGELEYNDKHAATAAYVRFPLHTFLEALAAACAKAGVASPSLLTWTTTPWTYGANEAIAVHADMLYSFVQHPDLGALVVATALAPSVAALDPRLVVVAGVEVAGSALVGATYTSPARSDGHVHPVVHADYVTSGAGTGLVHSAPGHGPEDYLVGLAHGLPVKSVVDGHGRFNDNLHKGFELLVGLKALKEGSAATLALLDAAAMVYHVNAKHVQQYPYCWRSKAPVVIRATPQWFINIGNIRSQALLEVDRVAYTPARGHERLQAFVAKRTEWCISRQRVWGVPLPIVYHAESGEPVTDAAVVDHLVERLCALGTDAWFATAPGEGNDAWLPAGMDATAYTRGTDTMDVWLDLGLLWNEVVRDLAALGIQRTVPADVYLEGSDQHRGWFQSSLLTHVAAHGVAPYNQVVTHGFTIDGKGQKMLKLLGNIVEPLAVINGCSKPKIPAIGVDGLRLWCASADYTSDVALLPVVLRHTGELVRKLRATLRFMLGNLNGFDLATHGVAVRDMSPVDRVVVQGARRLQQLAVEHYRHHQFPRVWRDVQQHMAELSAVYFDIVKDRLYADGVDWTSRRLSQTAMWHVYRAYVLVLAPVVPVVCQELWGYAPPGLTGGAASPFTVGDWNRLALGEEWDTTPCVVGGTEHAMDTIQEVFGSTVWPVRKEVQLMVEQAIAAGTIRKASECEVAVAGPPEHHAIWADPRFYGVLAIADSAAAPAIGSSATASLYKSTRHACPRCRLHTAPAPAPAVCGRCATALGH